MQQFACEMCGGTDLIKQDGVIVCQHCGMKYSPEEAKKMMIEGTVSVEGTVKVDNSAFVEKYLANARRAYDKEDWEEVEKYYNMVEQNAPYNMEAVFFSAFGKAMAALIIDDYYKKQQIFNVLLNSISVINDYYESTSEDKEAVLMMISNALTKMKSAKYVYKATGGVFVGEIVGDVDWHKKLIQSVLKAFETELEQIAEKHNEGYIQELIQKWKMPEAEDDGSSFSTGCGIAILVAVFIIAIICAIIGEI